MMAARTPVKEALTKVADLSTKSNGQQWKVCARVMKKYDKKVTSNNNVFFKVLLEDDSGKIEALTFGKENVERLFPLLHCKKVYYISNGRLKEVNKTFENVGHEYEIYLDETTTVAPCLNPADCPTTNSPYTPLCELPASSTPFTDVLGQLTEIGSMETKIVRDTPTQLLKIQLTDNRDGCKVDVALWGQKAADFKKIPLGKVIAIKNVKVNQYQGRHELSSTLNTQIDYNPSDAEAYILRHHGGTATKEEIATSTAAGSRMAEVRRRLLVNDTKESLSEELSDAENEAGEDEDDDEISPVRTRKRQIFQSDNDSDTERTPSNKLRERKHRSVTSLDSEEGETHNPKSESDQDSGSSKKKFRRIQLPEPESFQELDSSYPCKRTKIHPHRSCSVLDGTDSDSETVRTHSQETVEYNPEDEISNPSSDDEVSDVGTHSDDESCNDSDTTAGDVGASNESSSSDSDFVDSSLENREKEASKDPIFQPFRAVFHLIVLQAAGEEEGVQEVEEKESRLLESFDKQLESRLNLCQSQAWCERAATAVHRFPEFVKVSERDDLTGGDFDHLDNCEVCKREAHKWKYEVDFRGEPYNRVTFSQEDSLAEEEDELDLRFKMGRFCYERIKAYHRLFHWKFRLYQICKERLENVRLNTLQKDKNFLLETFDYFKKYMHRVTEDYTLDGEKRRGNRRYNREYGEID